MRRLKLDFAEPPKPKPKAVTPEGFRDYEGVASIYDTVLSYPHEAPAVLQYRPAAALDDAAIASGISKPIVNSHPRVNGTRVWVDSRNANQFNRGVIRHLELVQGESGKPELHVEFRVFDQALMDDIDAGKVDLSIGYDCKTVLRAGVTPGGETFDAVQEGPIIINHLAVEYRGRNPGARIKSDGQDALSMDEIIALINGGGLKPEDLQAIDAALKKVNPNPVAAPPPASDTDLAKRLSNLETKVAMLETNPRKADAAEVDAEALAEKVTKAAASKLQNLAAARELATPILGRVKADGLDDAAAIHRDVIIEVWPEMKTQADALFGGGERTSLASMAAAARVQHNKKITTDAADNLDDVRRQTPADRKALAARLGAALNPKSAESKE